MKIKHGTALRKVGSNFFKSMLSQGFAYYTRDIRMELIQTSSLVIHVLETSNQWLQFY